jgi:hypothetical protein
VAGWQVRKGEFLTDGRLAHPQRIQPADAAALLARAHAAAAAAHAVASPIIIQNSNRRSPEVRSIRSTTHQHTCAPTPSTERPLAAAPANNALPAQQLSLLRATLGSTAASPEADPEQEEQAHDRRARGAARAVQLVELRMSDVLCSEPDLQRTAAGTQQQLQQKRGEALFGSMRERLRQRSLSVHRLSQRVQTQVTPPPPPPSVAPPPDQQWSI